MKFIAHLVFAASSLFAIPALAQSTDTSAAEKAALSWLATVDAGHYAASWDQAASAFQSAVPKTTWEAEVSAARHPMGKMASRSLKSASYMQNPPGAPQGEYVKIQFNTTFENKPVAIETVVPMKDKDGSWKVSGYFIQ